MSVAHLVKIFRGAQLESRWSKNGQDCIKGDKVVISLPFWWRVSQGGSQKSQGGFWHSMAQTLKIIFRDWFCLSLIRLITDFSAHLPRPVSRVVDDAATLGLWAAAAFGGFLAQLDRRGVRISFDSVRISWLDHEKGFRPWSTRRRRNQRPEYLKTILITSDRQ